MQILNYNEVSQHTGLHGHCQTLQTNSAGEGVETKGTLLC